MKKMIVVLLALAALFSFTTAAFADQYVNGYTRKNGTYVAPYHRSDPDSTQMNNYSTQGNVNPYTGQKGYKKAWY